MTTLQILFGLLSLTTIVIALPYTKQHHSIRPRDVSNTNSIKRQTFGASFEDQSFLPEFSIQSGCAAALVCVEEEFCTMAGMISTNRIVLEKRQLLQRVPLTSCRIQEKGTIGKCCRDPNYVDPWPSANLPANYSGGFDEQGFPTFLNPKKIRPPTSPTPPSIFDPSTSPDTHVEFPQYPYEREHVYPEIPFEDHGGIPDIPPQEAEEPLIEPDPSDQITQIHEPFRPQIPETHHELPQFPTGRCGVKNNVPRPVGLLDQEAAFAEIPWQAMVLSNSRRKILCSGVLVSTDVVLTAARCVDRAPVQDVAVKLGEWKLGYELKHEEPLPFQIVNVSSIEIHPNYSPESSENDMAILFLERPVKFDLHVNPICLEDLTGFPTDCIVTGWGKVILQEHFAGAIMNKVNIKYLPPHDCEVHIIQSNSNVNMQRNAICTRVVQQRNNMCQVDIGGPMTCADANGIYKLIGIYSQDTGCLPTNQVAMFAPLDMPWINNTMHGIRPPKHPHDPSENFSRELLPDSTIQRETLEVQKSHLKGDIHQYLPPQNQF